MMGTTRWVAGLATMTAIVAVSSVQGAAAAPSSLTPVQQQLRTIYQELVETNTTNSTGSCTVAVTKMAKRLKAGGFRDADIRSWRHRVRLPRATWWRA